MADGKQIDIRDALSLQEKAAKVDQSEIDVAADDGGLSALVQKAAKADELEGNAEKDA